MDIEKICRTCLCLSGPLMSIYDESGSNSSLARMISDFTKTKPRRSDNLPEKVCLSCISEINRCYSFKLKCENSNRTLRQLLPDALPEAQEIFKSNIEMVSKSIQTSNNQILKTVAVQTINTETKKISNKEVQTILITNETATAPTKSDQLEVNNDQLRRKYETRQSFRDGNMKLTLKEKFNDITATEFKVEDTNAIVLEVHTQVDDDVQNNEDGSIYVGQVIPVKKQGTSDEQEDNSYYDISTAQFVYEAAIEENATDDNQQISNNELIDAEEMEEEEEEIEGEEYNEFICENSTENDDQQRFKIYNDENGETTIVSQQQQRVFNNAINEKPNKGEFKCPNCVMTFVFAKALKRHLLKRHGWNDLEPAIKSTLATRAAKSLNSLKNSDETVAVNEVKTQMNITDSIASKLKHFCVHCNAGFALRKSLRYHLRRNICTERSFKCYKCERVFISLELLKEHESTHIMDNICIECNKGPFDTADALTQHMIDEHKRNKRNQCNICKKVFTMLSSLKDHMRIHSGEKPFKCNLCDKAFNQNTNLKQHLMRHTNVKNFKCDECEKSFVTKAELFSHKRKHNGDQPFKCEFCDGRFTTSSSLVKHKRKHTGERPYACEICPMRFAALNVLKNHLRTHTGEKPFKCPQCDKSFTQNGDCKAHLRTHALLNEKNKEKRTTKRAKKSTNNKVANKQTKAFHVTILNDDDDDDEIHSQNNDLMEITMESIC